MGSVVAAFDAGDLRTPGKGSGQPHGKHRRLGSRVAEPHRVEAWHPLAQQSRQLHFDWIGCRETRASCGLLLNCLDNFRMCVAEDHRGVVAEHVDPFGAVRVPHPAALAALDVERIGVEIRGRACRAAGHDSDCFFMQRTGCGCGLAVDHLGVVDHSPEATSAPLVGPKDSPNPPDEDPHDSEIGPDQEDRR